MGRLWAINWNWMEEQETCWLLQKEEILLLRSIYCGEGECLVSCVTSNDSSSEMTEDALISTKNLSENEFIHICIKLHAQTHSPGGTDVEVGFTLPKGYPKCEAPNISITSKHMTKERSIGLSQKAEMHSRLMLPEACLYDALQKINDDIIGVGSPDPACSSELCKGQVTLATGKGQNTSAESQNLLKCIVLPNHTLVVLP